jgi:hypothetical protein
MFPGLSRGTEQLAGMWPFQCRPNSMEKDYRVDIGLYTPPLLAIIVSTQMKRVVLKLNNNK